MSAGWYIRRLLRIHIYHPLPQAVLTHSLLIKFIDNVSALGYGCLNIDRDASPLPLQKADDAEDASRYVAGKDGQPDVHRFQCAKPLYSKADAERDGYLRDDRDVERTFGVAGSLQSAGVGQGDGDEEAGEGQDTQKLHAHGDNLGVIHAEYGE